jgi:hypothetical protein
MEIETFSIVIKKPSEEIEFMASLVKDKFYNPDEILCAQMIIALGDD